MYEHTDETGHENVERLMRERQDRIREKRPGEVEKFGRPAVCELMR